MQISYNVTGQIVSRDVLVISDLTPGTRGEAELTFSFDSTWAGYFKKVIGFSADQKEWEYLPLNGGSVLIPDEFCDESFYFVIVGQRGEKRLTTQARKVVIK